MTLDTFVYLSALADAETAATVDRILDECWRDLNYRALKPEQADNVLLPTDPVHLLVVQYDHPELRQRSERWRRQLASEGRWLALLSVPDESHAVAALADGAADVIAVDALLPLHLRQHAGQIANVAAGQGVLALREQHEAEDVLLSAVAQMGQRVTETLNLGVILQRVLEEMPKLLRAEGVAVLLREHDELYFAAINGRGAEALHGYRMPATRGVAGEVASTGRSIWIKNNDVEQRANQSAMNVSSMNTRSLLAAPLSIDGDIVGVVEAVHGEANHFTEQDFFMFRQAARWISLAVNNARLYDRLQKLTAKSVAAEARIRKLIAGLSPAIAMFDNDMRFLVANDGWIETYRLQDRPFLGQSLFEIVPEMNATWQPFVERALGGKIQSAPASNCRWSDGTQDWIRWDMRPWRHADNSIGGLVMFSEIVTERVEQERILAEKSRALARSNDELRQLTYVASHDLKEPLRMVTNYLQLLKRRYGEHLDADAEEYIFYAIEGARRMKVMTEALLEYSRISRHGRPFAVISCDDILAEVRRRMNSRLEKEGVTLEVQFLPDIYGDVHQLLALFYNLIDNAVKYRGSEPPHVVVAAEPDAAEGMWRFFVTDNGIGFAQEYADRVFELFQRLHTRAEYAGTGVGLALCKKIVERHGGEIGVESEIGQGTTFYFTLPVSKRVAAAQAHLSAPG